MRITLKKIAIVTLCVLLGGCAGDMAFGRREVRSPAVRSAGRSRPVTVAQTPAPPVAASGARHLAKESIRHDVGRRRTDGTVEQVMSLMKEKADLAQDLVKAERLTHKLKGDNRQMASQISALKQKISQYQKSLRDAEAEVIAANKAIDRWKRQVTGMNDLQNEAHASQMRALERVLKALGVESVSVSSAGGKSASR